MNFPVAVPNGSSCDGNLVTVRANSDLFSEALWQEASGSITRFAPSIVRDSSSLMAERSRREQKSKLDKLAEYKRAREGGKRELKACTTYPISGHKPGLPRDAFRQRTMSSTTKWAKSNTNT